MITNPEEKVNALSKLADLLGKQTLVMWTILTTFTTCYLFIDGKSTERELNTKRIEELKESQDKLINEVKGVKQEQSKTSGQMEKFTESKSKLDTLIQNVNKRLN